jgi:hypothetical protein
MNVFLSIDWVRNATRPVWGAHAARVPISAARRNPLSAAAGKLELSVLGIKMIKPRTKEHNRMASRQTEHASGVCSPSRIQPPRE